jgi:hypothetical protein
MLQNKGKAVSINMETAFFVEILRGLVRNTNSTVQTRRSLPTSGMDEQHNRYRF